MLRMFRDMDRKRHEEGGFTLIELLVVIIIIGILAAIAIPVFLSQRERAWRSSIQSDLRNASVAEETYYTDTGNYTNDVNVLVPLGFNPTDRVQVLATVTADDQGYCLAGRHFNMWEAENTWFMGTGGTLSDDAAVGCPGQTAPTFAATPPA